MMAAKTQNTHAVSADRRGIAEGGLFLLLALALLVYALRGHAGAPGVGWPMSPYLFPLVVSLFLALLSLALLWQSLRGARRDKRPTPVRWRVFALTLGSTAAYALLMPVLGFVTATSLMLLLLFFALGERRPAPLILLAVLVACLCYLLFARLLYVMLPHSSIDLVRIGLDALTGG